MEALKQMLPENTRNIEYNPANPATEPGFYCPLPPFPHHLCCVTQQPLVHDIPYSLTLSLQKSDNVLFVDLNAIINQLEYYAPHLSSHEGHPVICKFISFHAHPLVMFF
ncbi:TPA: hypothetical protein L7M08_000105 [Klebsiella aerogenes]|nr:hypothetical protein [Klebsiella aerogenes]